MEEIMNIYEELEDKLSPNVTDVQSVMRAIDDAINFYNKSRNNPKYENIAPLKVNALRDLKKQIEDTPDIILQHAEAFPKIVQRKRFEIESEIKEIGNIFVSNGKIKNSYLELLSKKYRLSGDDILIILGVTVKKEKVFKDDGISEMNDGAMKSIGEKLAILDKKDIYDFLEINSTDPIDVCKKKTDEKCDFIKYEMEFDLRVTAYKDLVHICREIFKDEKSRRSYDKALENIGFTSVREVIHGMYRTNTKYISSEQYIKMLRSCVKKGINWEKAEWLIYTTAEKFGIEVDEDF